MNNKSVAAYLLIYTRDMPDHSGYTAWLLSAPVHALASDLDWDSLTKLLEDVCREPICLLELKAPFRTLGVYPPSEGVFEKMMKGMDQF